jgi:hypothetical protein
VVDENLQRVALNLGQSIVHFWQIKMSTPGRRFTATELRQYVQKNNFGTAPASADRVLRNLRKAGKLNYAVVNRAASLYEALPLVSNGGVQQ